MTGADQVAAQELPPWLAPIWTRLQRARQNGRLAHALLLTGPSGVGKRRLADAFAQSLLCREPDPQGRACGRCADCLLLAAGTHPDLVRVGPDPDAKSEEIPVGAVRLFSERESLTASRAAWKVALIDPADRLNPSAANALLKTLEEPAGQTMLCLIGERAGQLPATIRSRCLRIEVPVPSESEALLWLSERTGKTDLQVRLRLTHGAPLKALDVDDSLLVRRRERLSGFIAVALGRQDPLLEADAWNTLGVRLILDWLSGWICDVLRLMVTAEPVRLQNPDRRQELIDVAGRIDPAAGHRFLQRILEGRVLAETNVNHLLLLDSLAIEWSRAGRQTEHGRH